MAREAIGDEILAANGVPCVSGATWLLQKSRLIFLRTPDFKTLCQHESTVWWGEDNEKPSLYKSRNRKVNQCGMDDFYCSFLDFFSNFQICPRFLANLKTEDQVSGDWFGWDIVAHDFMVHAWDIFPSAPST